MPVAERTREQKNAVVRYWRNRDRFHLGPQATPTLYFDDKTVVKKSAISGLVSKTFDDANAKRMQKAAKSSCCWFCGSEREKYTERDKEQNKVSHS